MRPCCQRGTSRRSSIWARSNGCPWDSRTTRHAEFGSYEDIGGCGMSLTGAHLLLPMLLVTMLLTIFRIPFCYDCILKHLCLYHVDDPSSSMFSWRRRKGQRLLFLFRPYDTFVFSVPIDLTFAWESARNLTQGTWKAFPI